MNKAQLIEAIAKDSGLSKADARRALDAFVKNTAKALKSKKGLALVGFGKFSVTKLKAKTAKETTFKTIVFKSGSKLKSKVIGDTDDTGPMKNK